MAGNELARRTGTYGTATLSDRQQYALALARSGDLLPKSYWDNPKPDGQGGMIPAAPNPGKVLYMTETAAMLGIHPMAGLTAIHIIEGKPSLSASLWASLAREAGHRVRIWSEGKGDETVGIATVTRADDPDFEYRVVWSVADARTAGLLGKDNWKKYLRSMLKSRATTEVIREACPEVAMGAAYTPEELNPDLAVNEAGEPIEMQQVPDGPPPFQGGTRQPAPEQPPIVPREQPPIADEQTGETEDDAPDYSKLLSEVTTYRESIDLYRLAESRGDLKLGITIGRQRNPRPLEDQIKEIGLKLKEAEEIAARAQAEREQMEADGQVTDDDGGVVHAEMMDDDDTPMAMGGQ